MDLHLDILSLLVQYPVTEVDQDQSVLFLCVNVLFPRLWVLIVREETHRFILFVYRHLIWI